MKGRDKLVEGRDKLVEGRDNKREKSKKKFNA